MVWGGRGVGIFAGGDAGWVRDSRGGAGVSGCGGVSGGAADREFRGAEAGERGVVHGAG